MANEPITREEILLNAVATGEATNLEPITREEMFLAKLGGADVNTPMPITRKEQFLQKAIESGGSGGTGGGGDIKSLVERTITEIDDDTIEVVGNSAFKGCTKLTTADFPNCKEVAGAAFNGCTSLTSFNFDSVTYIAADSFVGAFPGVKLYIPGNPKIQYNGLSGIAMTEFYAPNLDNLGAQGMQLCASLTKVVMPALKDVQMNAFSNNRALEIVDLTAVSHIANAFAHCSALHTLVIRNTDKIVTFDGSLYYTKIASGEGYIYVTRAFLDDNDEAKDYRRATNWSTTGTQFRVLEDYTVDGTVTGELDESKI